MCFCVTHTVAGPVQLSPPLFHRLDGWPGSHHKHNGMENLAGRLGLLMIHVFMSHLPNTTPFSLLPPPPPLPLYTL